MKKFLVPAMLALLLITAGCEQPTTEPPDKKPAPSAQTKPDAKPDMPEVKPVDPAPDKKPAGKNPATVKPAPDEQAVNVKVYYPDDSGMRLVEVEREVLVSDKTDKYTAAVETLLEEPAEGNLTKIFPKNAKIRSVKVADGLATVDLDGNITKTFVGGSTGEEFLIGSVVDTLTNFPEVKRVKFLIDGQEIETLSGHMDLSTPLERMNSLTE